MSWKKKRSIFFPMPIFVFLLVVNYCMNVHFLMMATDSRGKFHAGRGRKYNLFHCISSTN